MQQAPRIYEFVNKNSGMCLDVKGQSKLAGAVVIEMALQRWRKPAVVLYRRPTSVVAKRLLT